MLDPLRFLLWVGCVLSSAAIAVVAVEVMQLLVARRRYPAEPWKHLRAWRTGIIHGTSRARLYAWWLVAFGASLVMFALVTQEYLQGVGRESAVMKGIVFLLAIVVLVVTFIGGKSTYQYRRMGHWSLELDVAPCRLGGQLSGNLVARSGVRAPPEIRAHLSCQFVGDESVESRAIWTSAPLLAPNESQRAAANGNTSFRLMFAVPRDQPPTDRVAIAGGIFGVGKPGIRWVVMVSSDDVPALRDSFVVPVFALPDQNSQGA